MKIYISGGMTGHPNNNKELFDETEKVLIGKGYEVFNPASVALPEGSTWEEYLKMEIPYLCACDGVVVLDGWERSRGATVEVYTAIVLGMKVYNTQMDEINPAKVINKTTVLTFITKNLLK